MKFEEALEEFVGFLKDNLGEALISLILFGILLGYRVVYGKDVVAERL